VAQKQPVTDDQRVKRLPGGPPTVLGGITAAKAGSRVPFPIERKRLLAASAQQAQRQNGMMTIAGTVVCGALGTVLLSEVLHWRASKRYLAKDNMPGRCALIVLGFPARRDGRLHPIQKWRTDMAKRAFDSLGAGTIVFSGAPSRGRPSEAETMAAYAVQLGVPATSVRTETRAKSTWQNIELSLPMVEGFDRLAIVSDPLHAARGRRFVRAQRPDLAAHLVSAGEYKLFERWWLKVPTAVYETYVSQYRRLRPGTRYR
jgi:vancomycin permeability regulator SanA